jgi:hypothetical protein
VNTLTRRAYVRCSCADTTDALSRLGDERASFPLPRFTGRIWAEPDGPSTCWLCLDGSYPKAGYRAALGRATQLLAGIARTIETSLALPAHRP